MKCNSINDILHVYIESSLNDESQERNVVKLYIWRMYLRYFKPLHTSMRYHAASKVPNLYKYFDLLHVQGHRLICI